MLTHGASWEPIAEKLALAMGVSPKQLSQWLGNGVPNISRVIECTKERITLIGLGALKKDEGDIFRLGVKAAGGIRDAETAVAMIKAGANRLGCSAGIKIIEGSDPNAEY